jgi:phosphate:Na+ symporter
MIERWKYWGFAAALLCSAALLAASPNSGLHGVDAAETEGQAVARGDIDSLMLVKSSPEGDGQYQATGTLLKRPFRVRVLSEDGTPVPARLVRFTLAAAPTGSDGARVAADTVRTDRRGYAATHLRLGSEPGVYLVTAAIRDAHDGAQVVAFRATARDSKWLFTLIVGLVGGLGVFLFGLRVMSEGMKKTAGERIRSILSTLTNNRFVAVGAGAFITMLMQSSSATTVMLVSFVRAGLMTFAQSVGMILGADIGTTITAQLIAFRLTDYALLMIGFGVAIMLLSRREKPRDIGETILGFGLLFFGMHVMSEAMAPVKTHEMFISLLVTLENPLLGLLVGTLLTALIQSSGAFMGILIVLASQGLLSLEAGIPLIFGANIGTCVTALLAGIGTNREAQRVALAHVLIKVLGVLLFVGWIPHYAEFIRWLSPAGDPSLADPAGLSDVRPRQIANAHSVFNVGLTVAMLPFTNSIARLVTRLLPDVPKKAEEPYRTRHIDRALLSTPTLALNLAKAEVLHMGSIVESMVEKIIRPFVDRNREVVDEIERDETKVDFLEDEIQDYLADVSRQSLDEDRITEVFQMMYTVRELEQIGDIITKNLLPRARGWLAKDLRFSAEGRAELLDYHLRTIKQLSRTLSVFQNSKLEDVAHVKKKHKKYRAMEERYMRSHYDRLRRQLPESLETSEYHQELMEQFRRITSHSTRIARSLLSWTQESAADGSK